MNKYDIQAHSEEPSLDSLDKPDKLTVNGFVLCGWVNNECLRSYLMRIYSVVPE